MHGGGHWKSGNRGSSRQPSSGAANTYVADGRTGDYGWAQVRDVNAAIHSLSALKAPETMAKRPLASS
jgi:hypothetical protein